MKSNSRVNPNAHRVAVGQLLNLLLADEFVLYVTTRDYHWNVLGPEFPALHAQFEAQYEQAATWIDDIAERARAIGIGARGNWSDLGQLARISAARGHGLPSVRMLSELLTLHKGLVRQLLLDGRACVEVHHDVGTADFLTGLMREHEKTAWMLRAQIDPGNYLPRRSVQAAKRVAVRR